MIPLEDFTDEDQVDEVDEDDEDDEDEDEDEDEDVDEDEDEDEERSKMLSRLGVAAGIKAVICPFNDLQRGAQHQPKW